ncbi:MAG TPA: BON domain-containing protein [Candidatus Sulfotelmatobacter sp.]|nr:BON domain-containing protein [Candidatus Sulfotelmatobacter sp.]
MKYWPRRLAAWLVALALLVVIPAEPLLGEESAQEAHIRSVVSAQLAKQDRFKNLTIEVDGTTVKVRGTVALLVDKKEALHQVGKVKHVRTVISHIRIKTERVSDASLLKQLQERLAAEGQIKLKVKEGVVTMQGLVNNEAHQDDIWTVVASTAGVIGISDQLQVAAK